MNVWIRRTTGVVMISAGLVAAASTAAAAAPGDDNRDYRQRWSYNQQASSSATSNATFNNTTNQKGYIPINVTAGNVVASEANATTWQKGSEFEDNFWGNYFD
ncbi:hypothetical protein [Cryptosporangium aurantiacum]|uniref:Uncharacterized protein n=1 Tax=Cryptosporangium aurantiacum TaxID=134849 RepID=A0A1M7RED5_9ACTN|nr:hypothetical protein [Cryptosporangium aurantiacum]SHN44541.1 hypothetical protein SAMN05443668_110252 [Cryptosporangium aurantiacum]